MLDQASTVSVVPPHTTMVLAGVCGPPPLSVPRIAWVHTRFDPERWTGFRTLCTEPTVTFMAALLSNIFHFTVTVWIICFIGHYPVIINPPADSVEGVFSKGLFFSLWVLVFCYRANLIDWPEGAGNQFVV